VSQFGARARRPRSKRGRYRIVCHWVAVERKAALRVLELVEAVLREPFTGAGKPEPLKHLLVGAWSRRITEEHRLVYLVRGGRIDFLQARYHY